MSIQRIWKVGFSIPVLSLGAIHPLAARAASPKRTAAQESVALQQYLQAAIRMYESLDYEQALEKLARAKSYIRDLEDDALISFYEGIILADLNRKVQSKAAFRSGLLLKPDARLPMRVSPKVEKDFEAVRADVQRELGLLQAKQKKGQMTGPDRLVDASRTALEPTSSAPEVTAVSAPRTQVLSYALMGGGAVAAGAGGVLGLIGLSFNERRTEMTINEAVEARATAGTQLSTGTFLLGTGLALLGTGTVLLLLPREETGVDAADSKPVVFLSPQPGGFALGSMGHF